MVDYLTVALIDRPHGLKGEVEITIETDFPKRFRPQAELRLWPPLPEMQSLTISAARRKNEKLLVKFVEINDRSAASALSGRRLVIPADEAAELPPDTYWYHDLIGMAVFTTDGRALGVIAEIMRTAAHDVYVVRDDREHLIPATRAVVKTVDLEKRQMLIEPPPGLIEE